MIYQKYLEMICECLFYEIINNSCADVIDARYDKNLQKYIKATCNISIKTKTYVFLLQVIQKR